MEAVEKQEVKPSLVSTFLAILETVLEEKANFIAEEAFPCSINCANQLVGMEDPHALFVKYIIQNRLLHTEPWKPTHHTAAVSEDFAW